VAGLVRRAVVVDRDGSAGRAGKDAQPQRVAVGVGVVGQGVDADGGPRGGHRDVLAGLGPAVDGYRDRRRGGAGLAVVDPVGERVEAVEAAGRGVEDVVVAAVGGRAVVAHLGGAVGGGGHHAEPQLLAVGVGVVGQDADGGTDTGCGHGV